MVKRTSKTMLSERDKITDEITLSEGEVIAGADYLRALRRLHFYPEVMCWIFIPVAYPDEEDRPVFVRMDRKLAIVSSIEDYAGPRAIYDLLFRAYDAEITPKQVDPFNVTLFSPSSFAGHILMKDVNTKKYTLMSKKPEHQGTVKLNVGLQSATFILVALNGVYVARGAPLSRGDSQRRFEKFKAEVDRYAA